MTLQRRQKVERIDQELAESASLLAALIFIAENTDDSQIELLRHSTIALAWSIHDKLDLATSEIAGLLQ